MSKKIDKRIDLINFCINELSGFKGDESKILRKKLRLKTYYLIKRYKKNENRNI